MMPKGFRHSEDTKRRISLANKGKIMSPESREKISLTKTGVKRLPFSEEWKEHLRKFGRDNPFVGHKHSVEVRAKMSRANRGKPRPNSRAENSYLWKGGISSENVKIRQTIEYRLWLDSVFARDGYTCQKTGIRGSKLAAHHIQNFAQFPELRFSIDNGITLSENSHKEFHKEYGIKNNTEEQLEKFLVAVVNNI